MASSVNNEAKVVHAARLERRRILEQQRAPLQPPPVSQQPQERRTPLRAETALQLFRYDMIGRDRDLGLKWNPCSAAHWEKSREEFDKLSQDDRDHYERQASQSKDIARANRTRRRAAGHAADAALADGRVPQALPQAASGAASAAASEAVVPYAAVPASLCPTLALHLCLPEPPLAARFTDGQSCLDLFPQPSEPSDGNRPGSEEYPITNELLRHSHHDEDGNRRPIRKIAKDFGVIAEKVVNNPTDGGFPRLVQYPKCCGAYCNTHTPQNLMLTYLAIEKALGNIATSNGSAASVSSRDMFIAVHCKGGAGSKYVLFHMLLAAGQSGHHAAWQVCALLDCLEGDVGPPWAGLLLQYGLREFVRPNNPPARQWTSNQLARPC